MSTEKTSRKTPGTSLRQVVWNLSLIAAGSVLCAMTINGILVPRQFVSGGLVGLALALHYLFPSLPVAPLYFVLNVPLFALGWFYVGRRFFFYSLGGLILFSCAVAWVHVPLPVEDNLLSALLAGILMGLGAGTILRSHGSAGGLDILSVFLLQRFSVRLGTTVLIFNSVVLLAAAVLFSLEGALYTLIFLYVGSQILNVVVTGLSQRKGVLIISPMWEEISTAILEEIRRGVTVIQGKGGYTGKEEHILYTVITFRELHRLKAIVRRADPRAFVVVADTLEVMGHRIGNQPHW